jgi:hypothetical protein
MILTLMQTRYILRNILERQWLCFSIGTKFKGSPNLLNIVGAALNGMHKKSQNAWDVK